MADWLKKGNNVAGQETDTGQIYMQNRPHDADLMKDGGTLYHEPLVIGGIYVPEYTNHVPDVPPDPYGDGKPYIFNPANGETFRLTEHSPDVPSCEDGYDRFRAVCDAALKQSRDGKGKERHATDEPFHEQNIVRINKHHRGFCLGQAEKKIIESERLPPPRRRFEILGAINYLIAEVITLDDDDREINGQGLRDDEFSSGGSEG